MKKNILLLSVLMLLSTYLSGQCFPDRHSTNFFDGWVSCEPAVNPNPLRPIGHFIMYDFGKVYSLGQMQIWNSNDPAHLDRGMKDVVIDYSLDGMTWLSAGEFIFGQATGLSTYEGEPGPFLQGVEARYLLITGITNYGGACYGLSEMHVDAEAVIISSVEDADELPCMSVSLFPNPFAVKMTLLMEPGCNGDVRYALYNALGHEVWNVKATMLEGHAQSVELGQDIPAGTYMLQIDFGGRSVQKAIIKMGKT